MDALIALGGNITEWDGMMFVDGKRVRRGWMQRSIGEAVMSYIYG